MYWDWLASTLKSRPSLVVNEDPGWKTHGHGEVLRCEGIMIHHTAGPRVGNSPSIGTVRNGRGGPNPISGPLANLFLARDGAFTCIAAGRAYHAGLGRWHEFEDSGNTHFVGIEAENTGGNDDLPWPPAQMEALAMGCAAIIATRKIGIDYLIGHKEWAPHRKIDPTFDMSAFRERVAGLAMTTNHNEPDGCDHSGSRAHVLMFGDTLVVARVSPDTLTLRDAPNGKKLNELPQGSRVIFREAKGKWYRVTEGSWTGWAWSDYLDPAP